MDYNSYKKYFLPQNNLWQIIGCVIIALGIPFFFFRGFGSMMAVVIMGVGACVFIFAKGTRPNDSEIDEAIAKKIKNVEDTALHGIDLREKLIKAFPPVEFSEYDYSGIENGKEAFLVQQGSDGKFRTNRYSSAVILFAQEKLHIYKYQFSVTMDTETEEHFAALYTDLKEAKIETRENTFKLDVGTKKEREAKIEYKSIVVRDNGEKIVLEMPVHDGADVDKTVETINRLIEGKKEGTTTFN